MKWPISQNLHWVFLSNFCRVFVDHRFQSIIILFSIFQVLFEKTTSLCPKNRRIWRFPHYSLLGSSQNEAYWGSNEQFSENLFGGFWWNFSRVFIDNKYQLSIILFSIWWVLFEKITSLCPKNRRIRTFPYYSLLGSSQNEAYTGWNWHRSQKLPCR